MVALHSSNFDAKSSAEKEPLLPRPDVLPHASKSLPSRVQPVASRGDYALVILAAVMQATRSTIAHALLSLTPLEPAVAVFMASFVFILVPSIILKIQNVPTPARSQLLLLAVHSFLAGLGLIANLIALSRLPVGTAMTLFGTMPAATIVIALVLLRDIPTVTQVLAVVVNIVGVALIARPDQSADGELKSALDTWGIVSALAYGVILGTALTIVRVMGTRVHFLHNTLAIGVGCAVLFPFFGGLEGLLELWRYKLYGLAFAGAAALGFCAQSMRNYSFSVCKPGIASAINNANIPTAYFLGLVFLGEKPDGIALVGTGLVMASALYIVLSKK